VSAGTDALCSCVAGCQLGLMHCVCLCCRVSAGTDAQCVPVLQGVSWD